MDFDQLPRVTIYLRIKEAWIYSGKGRASIEYIQPRSQVGVVVLDDDCNVTFAEEIFADFMFQRPTGTILSWSTKHGRQILTTDLELRFEETMGCSYIWDQMCSVQRSSYFMTTAGLQLVMTSDKIIIDGFCQADEEVSGWVSKHRAQ